MTPTTVGAAHVEQTVAECQAFLHQHQESDWTVTVPDLDMTVGGVVAHATEACLWYAIDLSARGPELSPVEIRVKPDAAPADLLDTLSAYATILTSVLRHAPDSARGFHPFGTADPSGFAAMACDELLVHTYDAALGLGAAFEPSPGLAAAVVERLFPWITRDDLFTVDPTGDGHGPWATLKWANGRIPLGGRSRLQRWRWHCAPLGEWNGEIPPSVIEST